jgi:predicted N-formylglutamate amidohydrolase
VTAESVCHGFVMAERPEDGEEVLVLCEQEPRHLPPHHGHLFYDDDDKNRCVEWDKGGSIFAEVFGTPGGRASKAS